MWVVDDAVAFCLFRFPVGAGVEDLQVTTELLFLVAERELERAEHSSHLHLEVFVRSFEEIDGTDVISSEYHMSHWSSNNTL